VPSKQHCVARDKKYNIDNVCANKAQDNRRNFNLLERLDVEPVIAIRNNTSTRERRCTLRMEEILLIKKLGYQRWKQIKDAGRRDFGIGLSFILLCLRKCLRKDFRHKLFTIVMHA
jgi:hypothetical protein